MSFDTFQLFCDSFRFLAVSVDILDSIFSLTSLFDGFCGILINLNFDQIFEILINYFKNVFRILQLDLE